MCIEFREHELVMALPRDTQIRVQRALAQGLAAQRESKGRAQEQPPIEAANHGDLGADSAGATAKTGTGCHWRRASTGPTTRVHA